MECYCVARNKPIRREITKPQAVCGFEVCLHMLNFIVIGQYTINIPENFRCSRFSEFDSNESATYIKRWAYTSSHRILGRFLNRSGLHLRGVITRIKPASKQAIQVLIKICFAIVIIYQ